MGDVWLHDLPDIIARAGIKVSTWPGWATRGNKHGGYTAIYGVAVHHTASDATAINDMTYMWNNAPLRPVGAIYLARDGSVTVGCAGQSNCQGLGGPLRTSKGIIPLDQGNRYAIAIEAANDGVGEPWPLPQQDTYVRLCAALVDAYDLQPGDVFAHHEWTDRKIDPAGNSRYATGKDSWDMGLFRADVAAVLTPPEPPIPSPTDQDTDMLVLNKGKVGLPGWTAYTWTGTHLAHVVNGHAYQILLDAKVPQVKGVNDAGITDDQLLGIIQSSRTTTPAPSTLTTAQAQAWAKSADITQADLDQLESKVDTVIARIG